MFVVLSQFLSGAADLCVFVGNTDHHRVRRAAVQKRAVGDCRTDG